MKKPFHLEAVPQPWSYNPSTWNQRIRICLVAAIPFLIATYMGLYQWRLIVSVWDPIFGDGSMKVLDSNVSHEMRRLIPIPDAILGAISYLGDIIFALAGSTRRWQDRPWLVILFGLDVIPLGVVSVILVILQGTVVGSWCFLCLVTAVFSLILILLAYDEVWSCMLYLYETWKKSKNWNLVWKTFWGHPSEIAYEAGLKIIARRSNVGPRR